MSDLVTIDQHWCLTEDRTRVVPETSTEARWTHWRKGAQVPREEAERLGAIQAEPPRRKPGRPPGSKNRTPRENK